uniref:Uncharacterized protein n=1 Tax=Meloidogyne javanica TaxID=6303 RepID=A0A915LF51_MELJA
MGGGGSGGSRRGRRREAEEAKNTGGDKKRTKAGDKGAGSSKGTEKHPGDKGAGGSGGGELPIDSNVATECELVNDPKRPNGYSVRVLRDANGYKKGSVVNIEKILEKLEILSVDANFGNSGKVHILATYENIPGVKKFLIMDIKNLVGLIADWEIGNSGDTNWKVEGKPSTNPIFEPIFGDNVRFVRLKWILYHVTIVK